MAKYLIFPKGKPISTLFLLTLYPSQQKFVMKSTAMPFLTGAYGLNFKFINSKFEGRALLCYTCFSFMSLQGNFK